MARTGIAASRSKPISKPGAAAPTRARQGGTIAPGDALLVEGNTRMSAAISYLAQSTWSHAALCVGVRPELPVVDGGPATLIEADVLDGVRAVPMARYTIFRVRICRPVKLTAADREPLIRLAIERIDYQYDRKTGLDLARYLLPVPISVRWRRRMMASSAAATRRARFARRCSRRRSARCAIRSCRSSCASTTEIRGAPTRCASWAHPPSQSVRTARLRHLAVFRGRRAAAGEDVRSSERP